MNIERIIGFWFVSAQHQVISHQCSGCHKYVISWFWLSVMRTLNTVDVELSFSSLDRESDPLRAQQQHPPVRYHQQCSLEAPHTTFTAFPLARAATSFQHHSFAIISSLSTYFIFRDIYLIYTKSSFAFLLRPYHKYSCLVQQPLLNAQEVSFL